VTFVVTGKLGGRNVWDEDAEAWPLMDAAAIQDWARRGLEFGGHGRTHRSLVALDEAALTEEVEASHADLRRLLGRAPLAFAYPYGHSDRRVRAKTAQHFALAYGTQEGANPTGADAWALRRTSVLPAYPAYEFQCQVRLGWGPRNCVRNIFQSLRSRGRGA
jgi:peptidoglycan/xylan/chitin deacetylase (PgdA/CDA1 family)